MARVADTVPYPKVSATGGEAREGPRRQRYGQEDRGSAPVKRGRHNRIMCERASLRGSHRRQHAKTQSESTPLVGKAPLGSLPAEKGQSAAASDHDYSVGDVVFCVTPTTAGEYTFIGHPRGDRVGKVLVLAHSGEIGLEVDADECSPTGLSNPQRGREYRQRCFRNHPPGLEGNP